VGTWPHKLFSSAPDAHWPPLEAWYLGCIRIASSDGVYPLTCEEEEGGCVSCAGATLRPSERPLCRTAAYCGRKQTKTHFELGTEPRPTVGENKQKRTSSWEPNRGPLRTKTNKNALRAGNRTAAHCGRKQTKTHFELGMTESSPSYTHTHTRARYI
jgi:hypothetical protein